MNIAMQTTTTKHTMRKTMNILTITYYMKIDLLENMTTTLFEIVNNRNKTFWTKLKFLLTNK